MRVSTTKIFEKGGSDPDRRRDPPSIDSSVLYPGDQALAGGILSVLITNGSIDITSNQSMDP
jgi:hypothetical protein